MKRWIAGLMLMGVAAGASAADGTLVGKFNGTFYKDWSLFSTRPDETKSEFTIERFGPVGFSISLLQPAFVMKIKSIEKGSPAEATGKLKPGQIIETVNGQKLKDIDPRIQLGGIITQAEATDGKVTLRVKDTPDAPAQEDAGPMGKPAAAPAKPAIELGAPFRDNAILQQQMPVPVWGTAAPGAKVSVTFAAQSKSVVADKDGKWRVVLDPLPADKLISVGEAPAGHSLTVVAEAGGGKTAKTIQNILVGEVWLCAGQSNMAGRLGGGVGRELPDGSVLTGNYPAFRQMVSPSVEPWLVCATNTAGQFKKTCFYFGHRLQRDILVPVGVINAAVGGSSIESWLNQAPYPQGKNYEGLIVPLIGYAIRGVVWYQGESNENDGRGYLPKLRSLIQGWRDVWGQGDFPFYFVQLPGIGVSPTNHPAGGDGRAEIRQAQFEALAVTNTGMAVTIDVGTVGEHPPNKYDTGVRLARLALHHVYGFNKLVPSGPLYRSHRVEGGKVRIAFSHAENGLMFAAKDGAKPPVEKPAEKLGWLSVCGRDGVWHWAEGTIAGGELVVSCPAVTEPLAVRYAYTTHPTGVLLYNKDGLPAAPFSTSGY